jgi:hypothetical protein
MAKIAGVVGAQFLKGELLYETNRDQYATTSYGSEHDMSPALIINATGEEDIKLAINFAAKNGIAVAVRTGGHQYSGASSTGGPNIQLDVSQTFRGPDDRTIFNTDDGKTLARTSVSYSLGEFNEWLGQNNVFVPHGQCTNVHLGGHVQTGGYGQLGRSFGLLGDHVVSLEIVTYGKDPNSAKSMEITKTSQPELFYAFLGGSPGNLGVLTHFSIEVHRDVDYIGSRALWSYRLYSPEKLKELLELLAEMSDNGDFPRNYDFCVSVLSASFEIGGFVPPDWQDDLEDKMKNEHPDEYQDFLDSHIWPRSIVTYAQWVPFDKTDVPDLSWFAKIQENELFGQLQEKPMSQITAQWIYKNKREFDLPYVKRTYGTTSTTLAKDGWPAWVSNRLDTIIDPLLNGCKISAQLQYFGGKFSKFTTNAGNGTSFSWRDSTILCTMDCFHEPWAKETAVEWQNTNDAEGVGPNGIFSKQDRRFLWGCYGDYDLDAVWQYYHEDEEKYNELGLARQTLDPLGVFTPNTFCVKRRA